MAPILLAICPIPIPPKPHPKYIVITAHYDHLGIQSGKLFYGADDNASGVAAMLAIASFLPMIDLHHSIIFLATDAEEKGLIGARVALDYFPIELSQIVFNLNLDMIAQVGKPAKNPSIWQPLSTTV